MITLRKLYHRSIMAMPFVRKFYADAAGQIFMAVAGENYHGLQIQCRHPQAEGKRSCECQWHPMAGTPMRGEMQGYYEPEWHEEALFTFLHDMVLWGNRKPEISNQEWAEMLRICEITPEMIADHDKWVRESV